MNKKAIAALSILSAFGCTSKNQPIDTTGFIDSHGETYKVTERGVKERVYGSRGVRILGHSELKAGETYVFVVEGSTGNVIVFGAPDKDIDIEDYKSFVRSIDKETKEAKSIVKDIYQLQDVRNFLSEIEGPLLEINKLLNGSTDSQVEEIVRNLGYDWPIDRQYEKVFLYTSPGGGGEVLKFTDAIHEISVTVNKDTTLKALQINPNKTEDGWRISEAELELDLDEQNTKPIADDVQAERQISEDGWIIPDEVNSQYDLSDPEQAILAYIEASNNVDKKLLEKLLPLDLRIKNTSRYMRKLKTPLGRIEYLFDRYVTNKNSRIDNRRERADDFRIEYEQIISENRDDLERYFKILQRIFSHVDDSVYMPTWSEYKDLLNSFEEIYKECKNMSRQERQEIRRFVKSQIPSEMIPSVWELAILDGIEPKGIRYIGFGLPERFEEHFIEIYREHANFLRLFGIDGYPGRYKPPFNEFPQPDPDNVLDIVNFCAQFYTQDPEFEIINPFYGIAELGKVKKFRVIDVSDNKNASRLPFISERVEKKVNAEVGFILSEEEKEKIPKDIEKINIELEKNGMRIENDMIIRKLPFTIIYEGSNTHVRLWN